MNFTIISLFESPNTFNNIIKFFDMSKNKDLINYFNSNHYSLLLIEINNVNPTLLNYLTIFFVHFDYKGNEITFILIVKWSCKFAL